jgi:cobalt/nickel transport system permease protein
VTEQSFFRGAHGHRTGDFVERLLRGLLAAMEHAAEAERLVAGGGLLQRMDPRVKTLALLLPIVTAVLVHSLLALGGLFAAACALAIGSRVSLARLALQVWAGVLLFTGVLAAPALFLVPGEPLVHLPLLGGTVTRQGLQSAVFLVGRAETTATYAVLLVLTTPWPHVLKALRSLGVPAMVVVILGMAHRYIFLLLGRAVELFEAQRVRLLAPMDGRGRRRLAAAGTVALLQEALRLSTEVHLAMVARGYRGEVRLLDDFRTRPADWMALAAVVLLVAAALGLQWLPLSTASVLP